MHNNQNWYRRQLACWQWTAFTVFVIDQLSKAAAEWMLDVDDAVSVMPGFNVALSFNKGAAFSFLADASGWQRGFLSGFAVVVLGGIVLWLRSVLNQARASKTTYKIESLSLALVFGGAVGNLADRLATGKVIDFIQWYYQDWYWPTFNIADAAICVGTVGLGWALLTRQE